MKSPTPHAPVEIRYRGERDAAEIAAPFMSQITLSPVVLLRHTMSTCVPLKSRAARTARVRFETAADCAELLPAASKAATASCR